MRCGFSLLELSIVLVIIGLLAGGVMVGQDLVRSAELNSIIVDINKLKIALNSFKLRYNALPGDMRNATQYWGIAAGTLGNDATCRAAGSTGMTTCNGNGNNIIGGQVVTGHADDNELFRAFQHLSNAGLIEGSYTGIAGPGGSTHAQSGINTMKSDIVSSGFSLYTFGSVTSAGSLFIGVYGLSAYLGAEQSSGPQRSGLFTPAEASSIDTKLDNSKPGSGWIRTMTDTFRANCVTSDDADGAAYQLMVTQKSCSFIVSNLL